MYFMIHCNIYRDRKESIIQGKTSCTGHPATASIRHVRSCHQPKSGCHGNPPLPPQVLPRALSCLLARLCLPRLPRLPLPKRPPPLCQEFQELQHCRWHRPQFWGVACRSLHRCAQDWSDGLCPSEHLCQHSCPENERAGEEGERPHR